jgi:hypothetical protein
MVQSERRLVFQANISLRRARGRLFFTLWEFPSTELPAPPRSSITGGFIDHVQQRLAVFEAPEILRE